MKFHVIFHQLIIGNISELQCLSFSIIACPDITNIDLLLEDRQVEHGFSYDGVPP